MHCIAALAPPLGRYMARVCEGERTLLSPLVAAVERAVCRLTGTRPDADRHWTAHAFAVLAFNVAGFLVLFAILRLQHLLPLNSALWAVSPPRPPSKARSTPCTTASRRSAAWCPWS